MRKFTLNSTMIIASLIGMLFLSQNLFALNVQTFRPKVLKDGVLTMPGSSSLEQNKWGVGLFYNYANAPLDYSNIGTTPNRSIVKHLHTIDALLAYGILDWWTVHLNVPFHARSSVERFIAGGTYIDDATSLGEIEVSMLFTLRKNGHRDSRRFGIGFMPFVTTKTGKLNHYLREDGVAAGGKFIGDIWTSKRGYLTANVGFRIRPREQIGTLIVDDDLVYGIGYRRILIEKCDFEFFTEFFGATTFRSFAKDGKSSPMELVGGFKKGWRKTGLALAIGAGRGFGRGYGTPDIRVFSGLTYTTPAKDKPLPIKEEVPAPSTGDLKLKIVDENGNAVASNIAIYDEAGNLVTGHSGDSFDASLEPGNYKMEVKADGFTTKSEEISIAKGETLDKSVSMDRIVVKIVKEKVEVNQVIYFDFNKASVKEVSTPVLDEVAKVLKNHSEIKNISIEGHTDSTGPKEFNDYLSSERAKSVMNYLIEKGVDAGRLSSKGFGPDKPIATNDNSEGRAKNRRVEFIIQDKE